MFDLINGLPVHPLVVHAVVVLLPLAVIGTIAIAVSPAGGCATATSSSRVPPSPPSWSRSRPPAARPSRSASATPASTPSSATS